MRNTFLFALALLLSASCSTRQAQAERVLFVGNSLTYVGNLPAVFSALAAANGHPVHSDMIVKGGATLSERVADRSVTRALKAHRYKAIVLQERGGDLMCSFGPDACSRSRQAIRTLARLARNNGAAAVLLGTYQPLPAASRILVQMESSAAADAGIPYIAVSEHLQRLRRAAPELTWFDTDGVHPGKDLILVDAILVHEQLLGTRPQARSLTVNAPIYSSRSGLTEVLRAADAAPPATGTPRGVTYSAATIETLLAGLKSKHGD